MSLRFTLDEPACATIIVASTLERRSSWEGGQTKGNQQDNRKAADISLTSNNTEDKTYKKKDG